VPYRPIPKNPNFNPPPLSRIRERALAGEIDQPGVRFRGGVRRCACGAHKFGFGESFVDMQTGEITLAKVRRVSPTLPPTPTPRRQKAHVKHVSRETEGERCLIS
jgi:hypothetical protein